MMGLNSVQAPLFKKAEEGIGCFTRFPSKMVAMTRSWYKLGYSCGMPSLEIQAQESSGFHGDEDAGGQVQGPKSALPSGTS